MTRKDIAILGAAGLTGRELLSLFRSHDHVNVAHVTSDRHAGEDIADVFPELDGHYPNLKFSNHGLDFPEHWPVFLAVPNETALETVPTLIDRGSPTIDLSGSFRIRDRAIWEKHYNLKHTAFDYVSRLVYGMPELFRDEIRGAAAVTNPGCYPTGSIIPLYLLGDYRNEIASIVIDAKSGVSGAGGRVENNAFAFGSVYENFRAYKIMRHQHQPEIEAYAAKNANSLPPMVFTPHLLPIHRGILSTIVIHWHGNAAPDLEPGLQVAAAQEPFVRFRASPEEIELRRVQHTNFVDFALRSEGNVTVIVSAIDNLVKGAAGQAIQNLNLMMGWSEETGLLPGKTKSAAAL